MTILKFALKRHFKSPWTIGLSFILPALILLMPFFWEGDNLFAGRGYYFLLIVLMLGAFPLTDLMKEDKQKKTLIRIFSTPTTNFSYLTQNFIASLTPLLLQIIFIAVFGLIRYSWTFAFAFQLAGLYLLFAATCISLAMAWNCLFKNADVNMAAFVTFAMMSLFFGVFVSVEQLNDNLRMIGNIFPSYWASIGIEALKNYGLSLELLIPTAVLCLFSAIFLLYGTKRGLN